MMKHFLFISPGTRSSKKMEKKLDSLKKELKETRALLAEANSKLEKTSVAVKEGKFIIYSKHS
jgi:hypothetical protein